MDNSIYLDVERDIFEKYPLSTFIYLIGARGIGKTYSALKYGLNHKFMFLRRTQTEVEKVTLDYTQPYKKLNDNGECNVSINYISKLGFGTFANEDKQIGYIASLSTFSGLRGIDFSDVEVIVFDEFIPEPNKPFLKGEYTLFKNVYETINRNRELEGKKAVKCLLMSNATTMRSPILIGDDLVVELQEMILNDISYREVDNKLLAMPIMDKFVKLKGQTELYKYDKGEFSKHALLNEFTNDSFFHVERKNLKEFTPFVSIDDIYIYRHKSNSTMYACRSKANCPKFNLKDSKPLFMALYGTSINMCLINQQMFFYDYQIKIVLSDLFKI